MCDNGFMRKLLGLGFVSMVLCVVAGCSNPDDAVVGEWNGQGGKTTFAKDHTFTAGTGQSGATGSWSLSGKKVVVTLKTIGGKSVDEFKKQMKDLVAMAKASSPASAKTADDQEKKLEDMIDKGMEATLSDDGKSLTMKNPFGTGGDSTLTKAEKK